MEISLELSAAKVAVETAEAHRDALVRGAAELRTKAAHGAARLPEIDAEIDRLRGTILEDDAVAGIVGAVRLSAKARGETERKIADLRTERAGLAQGIEGADAGSRALQDRITATTSAVSVAAGAFVKEKRRFDAALAHEFQGDFGRLTMPDLFRKWSAIPHAGIAFRLDSLSVATFGVEPWDGCTEANSPILYHGRYLDPEDGWIDWKAAWQTDRTLTALRDAYIAAAALERRCAAIVARDERRRQSEAEAAREAERRRRQHEYRYHPVPVTTRTAPMTHSDMEPRTPRPQVIGAYLGEAS